MKGETWMVGHSETGVMREPGHWWPMRYIFRCNIKKNVSADIYTVYYYAIIILYYYICIYESRFVG